MDKWEKLKDWLKDEIAYGDASSDSGTLQSVLYRMEDIEQEQEQEQGQ